MSAGSMLRAFAHLEDSIPPKLSRRHPSCAAVREHSSHEARLGMVVLRYSSQAVLAHPSPRSQAESPNVNRDQSKARPALAVVTQRQRMSLVESCWPWRHHRQARNCSHMASMRTLRSSPLSTSDGPRNIPIAARARTRAREAAPPRHGARMHVDRPRTTSKREVPAASTRRSPDSKPLVLGTRHNPDGDVSAPSRCDPRRPPSHDVAPWVQSVDALATHPSTGATLHCAVDSRHIRPHHEIHVP